MEPPEVSTDVDSSPGASDLDTDTAATPSAGAVAHLQHTDQQPEPDPRTDWKGVASKILHFIVAIYLFVLAIQLMKKGAAPIGARLAETPLLDNAVSTLGFGWLGAYFVLSGSPVAAIALTFFNDNVLTPLQTFTMLTGSRMGASFIVLLVGFLYSIRNKDRARTIGMGVLALSLTAIVYIPGMFIGYFILKSGALSGVNWHASAEVNGVIDVGWGKVVTFFTDNIPAPLLFPIGVAVILVSFKLLDRVLPDLDAEKHASARQTWFRRPWPMFFLGSLAALLTLSVSVALTVLVPLVAKGHVRRRETIPYIMGANITTLADTLVASMLLDRAMGAQIVLAEAIAVAFVTIVYLVFFYKPIVKGVMALDDWVVQTNRRVWTFVICLFLAPLFLLLIGSLLPSG